MTYRPAGRILSNFSSPSPVVVGRCVGRRRFAHTVHFASVNRGGQAVHLVGRTYYYRATVRLFVTHSPPQQPVNPHLVSERSVHPSPCRLRCRAARRRRRPLQRRQWLCPRPAAARRANSAKRSPGTWTASTTGASQAPWLPGWVQRSSDGWLVGAQEAGEVQPRGQPWWSAGGELLRDAVSEVPRCAAGRRRGVRRPNVRRRLWPPRVLRLLTPSCKQKSTCARSGPP